MVKTTALTTCWADVIDVFQMYWQRTFCLGGSVATTPYHHFQLRLRSAFGWRLWAFYRPLYHSLCVWILLTIDAVVFIYYARDIDISKGIFLEKNHIELFH